VKANITYCGVPMVCEFSYYGGFAQTMEEPGENESVSLESCSVRGEEINEMLTQEQWEAIEDILLTSYHEDREFQACEYADMKREEPK
jgi:hypothetical protein